MVKIARVARKKIEVATKPLGAYSQYSHLHGLSLGRLSLGLVSRRNKKELLSVDPSFDCLYPHTPLCPRLPPFFLLFSHQLVMCVYAHKRTHRMLDGILIMCLYPLSLVLVALLEGPGNID